MKRNGNYAIASIILNDGCYSGYSHVERNNEEIIILTNDIIYVFENHLGYKFPDNGYAGLTDEQLVELVDFCFANTVPAGDIV